MKKKYWDIPQPFMNAEQYAAYRALNEGIAVEQARPARAARQAMAAVLIPALVDAAMTRANEERRVAA